jgi:hypothetical protein
MQSDGTKKTPSKFDLKSFGSKLKHAFTFGNGKKKDKGKQNVDPEAIQDASAATRPTGISGPFLGSKISVVDQNPNPTKSAPNTPNRSVMKSRSIKLDLNESGKRDDVARVRFFIFVLLRWNFRSLIGYFSVIVGSSI